MKLKPQSDKNKKKIAWIIDPGKSHQHCFHQISDQVSRLNGGKVRFCCWENYIEYCYDGVEWHFVHESELYWKELFRRAEL